MGSLGAVAYEAYCKAVGGVSKFTGDTLPAFEDQDPEIVAAWEAAAAAVQEAL